MKKLLVMILVSAALIGAWRWTRDEAPAVLQDSNLVLDRIWIDHLPRSEKDTVQVFAAITEQPLGIFQAVSQWKGAYEIFRYEAHGGELRVVFPQTGDREKIRAAARKCDERGMDYCLELDGGSRGVKRYYSLEGWVIDGARTAADLDDRARQLLGTVAQPN